MSKIAELWAKEILEGHKTEEDVPVRLQKEVHSILLANTVMDESETF